MRKQILCSNYLTKFAVDLDGCWYSVETCWCSVSFIHAILKGDNHAYVMSSKRKKNNVGLYSDIYRLISFRLVMMIKTTKL